MKTKLVIFGITGDLSRHKLLPALAEIVATGEYDDLSIVGVSRRKVDLKELLGDHDESLAQRTTIFTMDLAQAGDYRLLSDSLNLQSDEQAIMYLSVPPNAAADIVDFLGQAGLNTPNVKILFEKPFGFDFVSAQELIQRTSRYFNEDQLYRIDHYMAKQVAQEIIRLRSVADTKHYSWNAQSIASIEIVASETVGVKDRAVFYEQTGAFRDLIQGHLMQLLSLVLMDIPDGFTLDQLSTQRLKALEQVAPADHAKAKRAQYQGYKEDTGNDRSMTETAARVELMSNDPRWQGTALSLVTGKKMSQKRTYIQVTYKDGTTDVFEEGKILAAGRIPDAYERVLIEAMNGRKAIFTTSPEVLRSWEIFADMQAVWDLDDQALQQYTPGQSLETLFT